MANDMAATAERSSEIQDVVHELCDLLFDENGYVKQTADNIQLDAQQIKLLQLLSPESQLGQKLLQFHQQQLPVQQAQDFKPTQEISIFEQQSAFTTSLLGHFATKLAQGVNRAVTFINFGKLFSQNFYLQLCQQWLQVKIKAHTTFQIHFQKQKLVKLVHCDQFCDYLAVKLQREAAKFMHQRFELCTCAETDKCIIEQPRSFQLQVFILTAPYSQLTELFVACLTVQRKHLKKLEVVYLSLKLLVKSQLGLAGAELAAHALQKLRDAKRDPEVVLFFVDLVKQLSEQNEQNLDPIFQKIFDLEKPQISNLTGALFRLQNNKFGTKLDRFVQVQITNLIHQLQVIMKIPFNQQENRVQKTVDLWGFPVSLEFLNKHFGVVGQETEFNRWKADVDYKLQLENSRIVVKMPELRRETDQAWVLKQVVKSVNFWIYTGASVAALTGAKKALQWVFTK